MIRMKLKPVVCALTIGSAAISNAGCNVDGTVDGFFLEADPAAQYAAASGSAAPAEAAGAEPATQAELRHFAIYRLYRAMADSSGGSGAGSAGSAYGVPDDASGNFILWGSRLPGVEHFLCPADELGK